MRAYPYILPAVLGLAVPAMAATPEEKVVIAPLPAWATLSELLPVPADATGPIFFRRYNSLIHLDAKGQSTFVSQYIRINNPNGLQIGNVQLSWNPAAGPLTVHELKIHRDGTEIDVLATRKFEILRLEDMLEQSMLTGVRTAVLQVPDLRVGDDLEFSATTPSQDPTLGADSAGVIAMVGTPPPGRYRMALSWDGGQESRIRTSPDLDPLLKRTASAIAIDIDNPTAVSPPKDAPPRYNWTRALQYSDFETWEDVSRHLAPLYEKAAQLSANSPLHAEAARIAAASADPAARAQAALKLVQQDVRYVFVGLNGGNITPASADDTWSRRYGDCKAKTVLLLALLKELGIQAQAVLVTIASDDDGLDTRLPSPVLFDHVVVRATINGENLWLDGTLPSVVDPDKYLMGNEKWSLPLTAQGATLSPIEIRPLNRPQEMALYEIDASQGFTQPAHIKQTFILRGYKAIDAYQTFSQVTAAQLSEAIKKKLEGDSTWNNVESVTWRYDPQTLASIFEIAGTGPLRWESEGGVRSMSLPNGGFSPPNRRQRGAGQDTEIPYYRRPEFDCSVTTVKLPKDTLPGNWSFNTSYTMRIYGGAYRRRFEQRDGAISMIRSYRTEKAEIDAQTAASDNQRLDHFDNSMAWIYYNPKQNEKPVPTPKVPATYEIDWVNHPLPCF